MHACAQGWRLVAGVLRWMRDHNAPRDVSGSLHRLQVIILRLEGYRTHALPPRSTVVSGRSWCGKPLNFTKSVGEKHSLLGTPRDLAFSNLNQIARRERRWIPLVKTHAYMCSARNLEYARLIK